MAGAQRGRRAWAVPLLLVLAIVIVAALAFNLANLEPFGESIPAGSNGGETREPAEILPGPIGFAVVWVLAAVFLAGTLVLLFRRRMTARRPGSPTSWWNLLVSVLGVVLLLAALIAFPRAIRQGADGETNPANATSEGAFVTPWPIAAGLPIEIFLVLSIFACLMWILYRFQRGARPVAVRSRADVEFPEARFAASSVVQETIRDLEIGDDVRTAVLACFQRFCRLLGGRGLTDQAALTPWELERLAVRDLGVSREASEILTALFEEARYSEHPLGDNDRRRAIESLGRIQTALGA